MSISSEITRIQTAVGNAYTAIQNKGGTLPQSQKVAGLADAIDTIPTGGGGVTQKLLNFYDYNGTLIESYGADEIQSLSESPTAPDHSTDWCPLTFQSWNWTLAQIKAYNTAYPDGVINVGATYVPTDGKTHIKFKIGEYDGNGVQFTIDKTGGTVNWGDGNTETISNTTLSHVYSSAGEYDCTLTGISSLTLHISGTGNQKYYSKAVEIRLGSSVGSIGYSAFYGCSSLQSVTIPNSVTSIGSRAFYGCSSLQSITIPSPVTSIEAYVFYFCYSLQSVTIPNSVTSIRDNAFYYCYSLQSVTIPSPVTSIGEEVFYYCYSLQSVTIPNSVTSIRDSAFYSCSSLQSVTISSSVTIIENKAFYGCDSLQSVTIPSSVTSIGDAFYYCSSLQSVTIPSSVTSIGSRAFGYCYSLYTVIVESTSPPTLSSTNAFNTSYQKRIWVPSSAVSTYKSASNWSSFSSIISANPN